MSAMLVSEVASTEARSLQNVASMSIMAIRGAVVIFPHAERSPALKSTFSDFVSMHVKKRLERA